MYVCLIVYVFWEVYIHNTFFITGDGNLGKAMHLSPWLRLFFLLESLSPVLKSKHKKELKDKINN